MPSGFPTKLSTAKDIALSESGDLLISATGDLELVTSLEVFQQEVLFRLKTKAGDYYLHPACGSSLDTVIGMTNSPATATTIQSLITNALTHDGFINSSNITITTWPTVGNQYSISVLIEINIDSQFKNDNLPSGVSILSIPFNVDLQSGLLL